MNYQKIYDQLIEKRRRFPLTKNKKDPNYIYCEAHHIIPRCLNGSDDSNNIVNLTAREHFIAHYLLWKIHPCDGTLLAFYMFKKGNPHSCAKRDFKNSRLYAAARLAYYEWNVRCHTGIKQSKDRIEHRAMMNRGKKRTLEQRKKMSENSYWKRKHLSDDMKAKISEATKNAMTNIPNDKKREMAQKLSQQLKGRRLTEEHKQKLSSSRKGLHWWNNGIIAIQRRECPGQEWKRGNLESPLKGKPMPEDVRRKISKKLKGKLKHRKQ